MQGFDVTPDTPQVVHPNHSSLIDARGVLIFLTPY